MLFTLTETNDRIDGVVDRIDRLEESIDQRFAAQDAKIDALEDKFDAKFADQDAKLEEINLKLTALIALLNATAQVEAALDGELLGVPSIEVPSG